MLNTFLSGAAFMGFAIATLFFIRFWQRSRDRLFIFFAGAFAALAIERIIRESSAVQSNQPTVYLLRLFAFVLILLAIIDKNRRS